MKIIRPTERVSKDMPGIFLAGPIQGARNWQEEAIVLLSDLEKGIDQEFFIASPRSIVEEKNYEMEAQVDWETEYLEQAGRNGVIMFWHSNEEQHFCHRAFAQTTRFELGEWTREASHGRANIVVGFDTSYPGTRYLKCRWRKGVMFPIVDGFAETVNTTKEKFVEIARKANQWKIK